MVEAVRLTEKLLGHVDYEMTDKKKKSREFSRSLYVTRTVKSGDMVTEDNIRSIRPGFGLHPKYYNKILGKKFVCSVKRGEPLTSQMIEGL